MELPNLDLSQDFFEDTPPQTKKAQWKTSNQEAEVILLSVPKGILSETYNALKISSDWQTCQ